SPHEPSSWKEKRPPDRTLKRIIMLTAHHLLRLSPAAALLGLVAFAAAEPPGRGVAGSEVRPPLQGHTHAVWSVAFSLDGKRLASSSRDHSLRVWDAASGKERLILKGH